VTQEEKYLFGPVPSRRLGLSLGVDIVPFKVCSLNCIYCQLGRTAQPSIERKEYVPVEAVLRQLRQRIAEGLRADHITISGSGEPTLNIRIGELIDGIKKITDIPVAVLTNGVLFSDKAVRQACAKADVVLPSLDAGDEETFKKINRPGPHISIENVICGLAEFRKEFSGQVWLEVFLVEGINTGPEQIAKIKAAIDRICPDKVQLNTAVRPTAERGLKRVSVEKMQAIAAQLGPKAEVVSDFVAAHHITGTENVVECAADLLKGYEQKVETVFSMLKRRPCSVEDICAGLSLLPNEAVKYISALQKRGQVVSESRDGMVFYRAK
jgi:wyosine [tRNA(Phe)-imidazoG37] synthetase (radical SAM superfamily)